MMCNPYKYIWGQSRVTPGLVLVTANTLLNIYDCMKEKEKYSRREFESRHLPRAFLQVFWGGGDIGNRLGN